MNRNAKILFVFGLALGIATLVTAGQFRLPGNHQGYSPVQPIAFSHRLHAGEMGLECLYCHYGARSSRHAGVPPTELCMNCHSQVAAGFDAMLAEKQAAEAEGREPETIISPELAKLYDALGLDRNLEPIPGREPKAVEWVRVHNLPDFVYFDHRPHVSAGVACQSCHGSVQSMERVRQDSTLSMGWCLECHRSSPVGASAPSNEAFSHDGYTASLDCATCHI